MSIIFMDNNDKTELESSISVLFEEVIKLS